MQCVCEICGKALIQKKLGTRNLKRCEAHRHGFDIKTRRKADKQCICEICKEPFLAKMRTAKYCLKCKSPQGEVRYSRIEQMYRRFDIRPSDFEFMLQSQGSRCGICQSDDPGKSNTGKTKGWCVDHDHSTGQIRGILCDRCNRGIGLLGDSLEGLERAVQYLTGAPMSVRVSHRIA